MPYNESQKNATVRYRKKNIVQVIIDLNKNNPDDLRIIDWLAKQLNRTAYLKGLILHDIGHSVGTGLAREEEKPRG